MKEREREREGGGGERARYMRFKKYKILTLFNLCRKRHKKALNSFIKYIFQINKKLRGILSN